MPEAGRTPSPAFERGVNNLEYGEAGLANDLMALAGPAEEPEPYQPSGPEEEFLFAPSDRPAEPVTAGVPVGEGPDASRYAIESPQAYKERMLSQMEQRAGQSRDVRRFIERARKGL